MELHFAPVVSWTSLALLAGGLLAEIVWSYRRGAPATARWPFRLRLASWLVLLWMLLRPTLEITETEATDAVLLIAADASPSMQTRDLPGSTSRRKGLLTVLDESAESLERLQPRVTIRRFDFATELDPVQQFSDRTLGNQTSLVRTLEQLLDEAGTDRSAGVLYLSDGAQRAYPPLDGDPRSVALRFGEQRIPIRVVPFGATGFSEATLDLAIEEMLVDPFVFADTTVPVSVRLRAIGAAGQTVTVRLKLEDRTGKSPGQPGELRAPPATGTAQPAREIAITSDNQLIPLDLSFVPTESGEFRLHVEVDAVDREVKTVNNARETIVSVRKGGIRVALFHTLLPEQKFLRQVNRSEQIQIDFQLVTLGGLDGATPLKNDWFEPGRYDAYILGDVPAAAFSPAQLRMLADRVRDDGAGLMMLGGLRSFGPGGFGGTPLEEILPVVVAAAEKTPLGEIDPSRLDLRELKLQPTPRGRTHYLMNLGGDSDEDGPWNKLPPLQMGNRLTAKNPLVEVLAAAQDGTPLLFAHEIGQARVLAFAGNSTWRWHLHGFKDELFRFWQQVVLWLSRKELDSDQDVWVRVNPRNFGQGERVPIEFGARDEEGRPLTDVDFAVDVLTLDGTETSLPPRQLAEQFAAEFQQSKTPGDYWVRVAATRGGQSLGLPVWTRFLVDDGDIELDNPAADPALLEEIASLSGGGVIQPESLAAFLEALRKDGLNHLDNREVRRISLWDNAWLLLAFVGLLSLEWFLRKRKGLV